MGGSTLTGSARHWALRLFIFTLTFLFAIVFSHFSLHCLLCCIGMGRRAFTVGPWGLPLVIFVLISSFVFSYRYLYLTQQWYFCEKKWKWNKKTKKRESGLIKLCYLYFSLLYSSDVLPCTVWVRFSIITHQSTITYPRKRPDKTKGPFENNPAKKVPIKIASI